MSHVNYEKIAESLNEWTAVNYGEKRYDAGNNWLIEEHTGDAISALGVRCAEYLLEEHGVIVTKTQYRESYDGLRIWLRPIKHETVERTVTEEQYQLK